MKYFLLIFVCFYVTIISAQEKTMADLKAALVLKLCDYIIWPDDTNKYFTVGIMTENDVFIEKFKALASKHKIANRNVSVIHLKENSSLPYLNLLLVKDDMSNEGIFAKVEGRKILLISEDVSNSKAIMFNLLTNKKDGLISFEFNRANIIFNGFELHPDIIELRGSEIDVRELYRQTKTRLEKEETNVKAMQNKLDSQRKSIDIQKKEIDNLSSKIEFSNLLIDQKTDSIKLRESNLRELALRTLNQEKDIRKNITALELQKNYIANTESTIRQQNKNIAQQVDNLRLVNAQVDAKEKELIHKDSLLAEKEMLLKFKNNILYLLMALIFLIFSVIFLIMKAYTTNRKAKQVLSVQKEELEIALDKLTQAQAQLVQSEKMASLGVLTAGIAHEINNPVNFINSGITGLQKVNQNILQVLNKYRETYNRTDVNKEIEELEKEVDLPFLLEASDSMLLNVKTGVERTVNIINSLRAFARSDEEVLRVIDIHESIELALTILYNQYKYHVEIVKEYNSISKVECFPGKLNQMLMNLLSNAIQSITDKGIIEIKTWDQKSTVCISIKDNGCGIPEHIQSKIFDPFFTTKEVGKGTGLGLSIVFSIIQEHKGLIDFTTKEGQGTEFIITLPTKLS